MTLLGFLSSLVLALGLLSGGQLRAWGWEAGMTFSLGGALEKIDITPWFALQEPWYSPGRAVTIGGVTLYQPLEDGKQFLYRPNDFVIGRESALLTYERRHLRGWEHWGVAYVLEIMGHGCWYDPQGGWEANCRSNEAVNPIGLSISTGWWEWTFP